MLILDRYSNLCTFNWKLTFLFFDLYCFKMQRFTFFVCVCVCLLRYLNGERFSILWIKIRRLICLLIPCNCMHYSLWMNNPKHLSTHHFMSFVLSSRQNNEKERSTMEQETIGCVFRVLLKWENHVFMCIVTTQKANPMSKVIFLTTSRCFFRESWFFVVFEAILWQIE